MFLVHICNLWDYVLSASGLQNHWFTALILLYQHAASEKLLWASYISKFSTCCHVHSCLNSWESICPLCHPKRQASFWDENCKQWFLQLSDQCFSNWGTFLFWMKIWAHIRFSPEVVPFRKDRAHPLYFWVPFCSWYDSPKYRLICCCISISQLKKTRWSEGDETRPVTHAEMQQRNLIRG